MNTYGKLTWGAGVVLGVIALIAGVMTIFNLELVGPSGRSAEASGPKEAPQFEASGIVFVFKGCSGEGSSTVCDFLIENQGESALLVIGGATGAYDLEGSHNLREVRIGEAKAQVAGVESFASFNLEGKVAHKCSLIFERVHGDIQKIKWSFAKLPPERYDLLSDIDEVEFFQNELFPRR